MVAFFEERMPGKAPWTTERVEDVHAQLKLIQHKDTLRHRGAIAGLRAQADADSHAIADLMQETLEGGRPARGGLGPG